MSIEMKSLRSIGRLAIASLLVPIALTAAAPEAQNAAAVRRADASSAPSAELLEELKQWKLDSVVGTTRLLPKQSFESAPERNYTLKHKVVRKFLHHEEQPLGINLGLTDNASLETGKKVARWFFTRNGRADGPLVYGEVVAMAVGKDPSFLCHEKRDFGINLAYCSRPVFEWRLMGGPAGHPIDLDRYIAIYNVKAGEFVIFFDRTPGMADVGWPSSQRWGEGLKGELLQRAKKAVIYALLAAAAS